MVLFLLVIIYFYYFRCYNLLYDVEVILMKLYIFLEYFLVFLIYSFIGWMMEVILTLIREKRFVDRGFLLGPYCPIYGYGMLLIIFLLRNYTDNFLVLFILSMVICLVLEYFTSYFMEVIFNARWWDYSNKKYNINGRICLEYGVLFGIGGCLIMYIVHPFIMNVIGKLSNVLLIIVGMSLLTLYVIDCVVSFNTIFKIKGVDFKDYVDNTEEITELVKEHLMKHSKLTKRLAKAYPNIHMKLKKKYYEQKK